MPSPRFRKPQVYRVEQWGPAAGGASGTRHVTILGYAKENSAAAAYCTANEFICSRLGQVLSLPIPPGAIVEGSGTASKAWVTLSFSAVPLPPVDPASVVAAFPTMAAELVVFDILIANPDRHTGNLALMHSPNRLEVYDHSHALLGTTAGDGVARLRGVSADLGIGGHCLAAALTDGDAIARAVDNVRNTIRDLDARRICTEAGLLDIGLSPAEAREVAEILNQRRRELGDLVSRNKAAFPNVHSWPALI